MTSIKLRDYQQDCVEALAKEQKAYISAPTGAGKTIIMAGIIDKIKEPTLVIVPSVMLAEQAKDAFEKSFGNTYSMSIINAFTKDKQKALEDDIVIATWQSLAKMDLSNTKHKITLVDECHRAGADVLNDLIKDLGEKFNNMRIYGLSATPYRTQQNTQDKMLSVFNKKLAYEVDINMLYERGYLMRPKINIIKTRNTSLDGLAKQSLILSSISKAVALSKGIEKPKKDDIYMSMTDTDDFEAFFSNLTKKCYVGINLQAQSRGRITPILTEKFGKEVPINAGDLRKAIHIISDYIDLHAKNNNHKLSIISDALMYKAYHPYDDFSKISSLSENEKEAFNCYTGALYYWVEDFFNKNPKMLPSKWENIGMKIGYAKKNYGRSPELIKDSIKTMLELQEKNNNKMLIIADNKFLAQTLYSFATKNQIAKNVLYIDGDLASQTRKAIMEKARNSNDYIIIATTQTMSEGVDIPNLTKILSVSPLTPPFIQSNAIEQALGRVMRVAEGKESDKVEMTCFHYKLTDFKDDLEKTINRLSRKEPSEIMLYNNFADFYQKKGTNVKRDVRTLEEQVEASFNEKAYNEAIEATYYQRLNKSPAQLEKEQEEKQNLMRI